MINPLLLLSALAPAEAAPAMDPSATEPGKADFQQVLRAMERAAAPATAEASALPGGKSLPPGLPALPPQEPLLPPGRSQLPSQSVAAQFPLTAEGLPSSASSARAVLDRQQSERAASTALEADPPASGIPASMLAAAWPMASNPVQPEQGRQAPVGPADGDPPARMPVSPWRLAFALPLAQAEAPARAANLEGPPGAPDASASSASRPSAASLTALATPATGTAEGVIGDVESRMSGAGSRVESTAELLAATLRGAPAGEGPQPLPPAPAGPALSAGPLAALPERPNLDRVPSRLLEAAAPDALASRLRILIRQGSQEATLQLQPAELGRLQVSISTEGDQARVLFVADSAAARDAIEQSLPRLRELLAQSGLQLAHSEVSGQGPGNGQREPAPAVARAGTAADPLPMAPAEELPGLDVSGRLLDCYI